MVFHLLVLSLCGLPTITVTVGAIYLAKSKKFLDRLPVHHRTNTQTGGGGGTYVCQLYIRTKRKPTHTWKEYANGTQKKNRATCYL